jgi:UDP-glucose 4-epimerase
MDKILITGATGCVGKNLMDYFTFHCHEITGVGSSIDLTNGMATRQLLNDVKPNVIIHLAAKADPNPSSNDPFKLVYENIEMTKNLCKYARPTCKMVFMSSLVVYGNTPHKMEEHEPLKPISAYGISKKYCEDIVTLTRSRYVILRPCAIVGPHLTHGAVFDFIRKLKSDSEELELFGDCPGSIKPYLHVHDLIGTITTLMNRSENIIVNVTPDESISIDTVSDRVMKGLEITKPKKWLGSKSTWGGRQ